MVISVAANLSQIGQFLGLARSLAPKSALPFVKPPTPVAAVLIDEIVNESERHTRPLPMYDSAIEDMRRRCTDTSSGKQSVMRCRILLGEMYEWEGHYKAALTNYDLARDIAPHTADAYYARGGLYYELGLFDAVRRRRFDFDPNNLTARVYPDERTSVLMSLANEEYTEAERYPGFDDLVSLSVAAHRRSQIRAISGGSSYVGLHKLELLLLMPWVGNLFPDDRDLVARSRALALNLIHYMRDHPSEFPDVPQSMLPRPR